MSCFGLDVCGSSRNECGQEPGAVEFAWLKHFARVRLKT